MMSLGLPSAIDDCGRHHPSHEEQEVGGFWVNGVQRGWVLAEWADFC